METIARIIMIIIINIEMHIIIIAAYIHCLFVHLQWKFFGCISMAIAIIIIIIALYT